MKDALILEVKFQKIGNKIKYTLPVKMYCERMQNEIPNSATLDISDLVIKEWLGETKDVKKIFKKSTTIFRKVNLSLVYDKCDKPIGG